MGHRTMTSKTSFALFVVLSIFIAQTTAVLELHIEENEFYGFGLTTSLRATTLGTTYAMFAAESSALSNGILAINASGGLITHELSTNVSKTAATSVLDRYYIVAGGDSLTNTFDIFDAYTGSWSQLVHGPLLASRAAASSGRFAVFAGGVDETNSFSDQVHILDTSNFSWTTSTLSEPRYGMVATSVGDLIFFAAGIEGPYGDRSKLVEVFNISSMTWSNSSELSSAVDDVFALSVNDLALFSSYHSVDIYDAATQAWISTYLGVVDPKMLVKNELGVFVDWDYQTSSYVARVINSTTRQFSDIFLGSQPSTCYPVNLGPYFAFACGAALNVYDVDQHPVATFSLPMNGRLIIGASSAGNSTVLVLQPFDYYGSDNLIALTIQIS